MKIRKADFILIGCLLAAALIFLIIISVSRKSGTRVVVYIDGQEETSFSLDDNTDYTITTNAGVNDLVIRDGEAWLSDADCPDGLCVNMGKIRYDGETIVCLPHKVVVAIEGGEKRNGSGTDGGDVDIIAR